LFALPFAYGFLAGLALRLVESYGVVRPGLAQPPALGEGERDRDIGSTGLAPPDTGVPGMVERMRPPLPRALPLSKVPDVVPRSEVTIFGVLAEERRRCEVGLVGEARLGNVSERLTLRNSQRRVARFEAVLADVLARIWTVLLLLAVIVVNNHIRGYCTMGEAMVTLQRCGAWKTRAWKGQAHLE
jgi:hypothetical protein